MTEIRYVSLPERTDEERAADAAFAERMRTENTARVARAEATVKCRTCKAEPGTPCTWKTRPFGQRVHAPRINAVWRRDHRTGGA